MRSAIKRGIVRLLQRALATEEGREAVAAAAPTPVPPQIFNALAADGKDPPYREVGQPMLHAAAAARDPVLITGRFRSGTTLLWNIFRHVPGCTAYYEPFNERRWFDPKTRGTHVDPTHRHVNDYWREYDGLPELGESYREEWTRRELFMHERTWNPRMKRYIDLLIERAEGRAVLQFNRLDFRLPWVRRQFPTARIVHIYRHPRDQWCSTFLLRESVSPHGTMRDFEGRDEFYLRTWVRDLRSQFPFLDERDVQHPYQLHYYIWRLSYLFGTHYADHSLAFEDLIDRPQAELARLFDSLAWTPANLESLSGLVERPRTGKWRDYADHSWFARHESHCEDVLATFLGSTPDVRRRPPVGTLVAPSDASDAARERFIEPLTTPHA